MATFYLGVSRCLDACALDEVARLVEEYCGCSLTGVYGEFLRVSCESEEEAVACALRADCVREVIREVGTLPWDDLGKQFPLEKLSEIFSKVASPLRGDRSSLKLCVEFYDPQSRLCAHLRESISNALLEALRQDGIHVVPSRSLPDLIVWIGVLDSVTLGLKLQTVRGDRFEPRAPGKRVYERPFALKAELARLLVNLSSPLLKGPLLDPFCGTGSVLIEAALEGIYAVGVDINYDNVRGARRNALQLGVYHGLDIILSDSVLMPFRSGAFEAAAFDPPYGRAASSARRSPALVLAQVLSELKRVLKNKGRAAFLAPSSGDYAFLGDLAIRICSIYVHSSLTREVWLFTVGVGDE